MAECQQLLADPSEAGIRMECVAGRDRVDCLELIEQRKADVLATEPEDMYIAYHRKNEDYRVISEIRTQQDKDGKWCKCSWEQNAKCFRMKLKGI